MMIVGRPEHAEVELRAGEIVCPRCSARLRPYGHAWDHTVRGLVDTRLDGAATTRPLCGLCCRPRCPPAELTPWRSSGLRWRPRPLAAGTVRSPLC